MADLKSKPEIRFAGFTDAWEQRKLGDLGATFTGLSGKTKDDFGHGNAEFVTYMNVFSNPISAVDGTECVEIDVSQSEVQYGDVFFTTSSETPEEVGMSSIWLDNRANVYLNSFCFGWRPTVKIDPYYLAFMLRSAAIRKKFIFLAQGISRYNISKNKVMKMAVPVPSLDEQKQVGKLFIYLDRLITLHQREYSKTVNIKKAMLEKMFPKDGADRPEIRFAGFTDAWEQRKLGGLCDEFRSGEFIKASDIGISGNYPVYGGNGLRGYASTHNHDGEYALIGRQGALCGNMQYSYGKAYFTEHAIAVKANEKNETRFLYYLFGTMNLGQYSGQSAQPGLAVSNLIELTALLPKRAEQTQIATMFTALDHLITLHQRELIKLQNVKKSLLEKMFI